MGLFETNQVRLTARTQSVFFADIRGFSKVKGTALYEAFITHVFSKVVEELKRSPTIVELNTWGDGFFCIFDDFTDCCRAALRVRDIFKVDFSKLGLPNDLNIRIAIHHGVLQHFSIKGLKLSGAIGADIVACARIEPIVAAGSVWATEQIKTLYEAQQLKDVLFSPLGLIPLAKGAGEMQLFEVLRDGDIPRGIPVKASPINDDDYTTAVLHRDIQEAWIAIERLSPGPELKPLIRRLYKLASEARSTNQ